MTWFIDPQPGSIDERGLSEKRSEPESRLPAFKTFWNSLSEQMKIVHIQSVSEEALIWEEKQVEPAFRPPTFRLAKIIPAKHTINAKDRFLATLTTPQSDLAQWIKTEPALTSFAKNIDSERLVFLGTRTDETFPSILIPVETLEIEFNGQKAFQAAHGAKFPYGKFEDAFADLDQLTKNFQDLPYARLIAILENEARRTSDRVEMFGAKIPANALAVWGSPIIILVQFYLFLHLSAFQLWLPNWPKVTNIAWIGLYPSWSARFATLLSVGLLPTCVIGFLLIKQALRFTYWWELPLIAAALSASVIISVASGIRLVRIWRAQ